MTIPSANYVVDNQGQKVFVQLSVQDWEKFIKDYKRVEGQLAFKKKLKNAFLEVRQIKRGELQGISLDELLDEL